MSLDLDHAAFRLMRGAPPAAHLSLYEELRSAGPAHRTRFGIVFVTGYHLGRDVLRSPAFGVTTSDRLDRVWPDSRRHPLAVQLLNSVFGTDPPAHKALRDPLRPHFSEAGVRTMDAVIDRSVTTHAAALRSRQPIDVMRYFARPVAADVIGDVLGIPARDLAELEDAVTAWTAALELSRGPQEIQAADLGILRIRGHVSELIDQCRRAPDDTLISRLTNEDSFADDDLLNANIAMLLAAGLETTSALLGNLLHAAATTQRAKAEAIAADPAMAARFVDESLRLEPPLRLASRVASRTLTLHGYDFDADADVFVLLGACNRDPAVFPVPDGFDWTSTGAHRHLSFGGGAHHCLGALLARRTALRAVAELGPARGVDPAGAPTRGDHFVLGGFDTLPMRAQCPSRSLSTEKGPEK